MMMAHLQIKNVPERINRELRRYAKRRGRSLRDVVLEAVAHQLDDAAFAERLAKREPVDLGTSAAALLEAARAERSHSS